MKIEKLKVGDWVTVDVVYTSYGIFDSFMYELIGKRGVVCDIRGTGTYKVQFSNTNFAFLAGSFLRKDGDSNPITSSELKPNKPVYVGRVLDSLNYRKIIIVISLYSETKIEHVIDLESANRNTIKDFYGKKFRIINEDYHVISDNRNGQVQEFVGVEQGGVKYYLPMHVLYSCQPEYQPRKIIK